MVLKFGHFSKEIRNTWEVLKCVMEKISWTNCVRNEEVLQGVKEDRNVLQTIKKKEG